MFRAVGETWIWAQWCWQVAKLKFRPCLMLCMKDTFVGFHLPTLIYIVKTLFRRVGCHARFFAVIPVKLVWPCALCGRPMLQVKQCWLRRLPSTCQGCEFKPYNQQALFFRWKCQKSKSRFMHHCCVLSLQCWDLVTSHWLFNGPINQNIT